PGADVVNGMMYEPMESQSSVLPLIHTGNIVINSPTAEALTVYLHALIEPATLLKQLLQFKRTFAGCYSAK
ncbi:TPA: hypothetical protein ACHWNV_005673, partial [Raoultella ornithinolytica]